VTGRTSDETIAESFLTEYDQEMATTRRLLERVPAGRMDWKPHPKSRSLGQVATHVTELARWGVRIGAPTFAIGSEKAPSMASAEEFLRRFDENVSASRAAIASTSADQLKERFVVTREGAPFFEMSKASILRRVLLNHLIHHRGQLTVYLRSNDVPLPAIYGPTADES
jgi:uncharacterized damage-inducible protein DinB